MSGSEGEQPQELIRMRQRLDEVRRGTRPGVRFPGWVWAAAARLARRHGVHRTARALGLEYNKLKGVVNGAVAAAPAGAVRRRAAPARAVRFVELTGTLPALSACRLSLCGAAGQRLELEMAPAAATEVLLGLTRAGWGRGA